MRKILKGIITSVFALSLILPATVTTTNALDISGYTLINDGDSANSIRVDTSNYTGLTYPVGNSITGTYFQDKLYKYAQNVRPVINSSNPLVVDMSGITINGGFVIAYDNITIKNANIVLGGLVSTTNPATDYKIRNVYDYVTTAQGPYSGSVDIEASNVVLSGCTIDATHMIQSSYGASPVPFGTIPAINIGGNAYNNGISSSNKSSISGVILDKNTLLLGSNVTGINANIIATDSIEVINNKVIGSSLASTPSKEGCNIKNSTKLTFTGNTFTGIFNDSPRLSSCTLRSAISNNHFNSSQPYGLKLYSTTATSGDLLVQNNEFSNNCVIPLYTDNTLAIFNKNDFTGFGTSTITGVYEVNPTAATFDSVTDKDQNTHKYTSKVRSVDGIATTYMYGGTSTSPDPSTNTTYYPYIPYYPTTTTTPATTVGDPFVYVYKDTPITTPTTTTPTTTTDTTSRRDRTDRTTRSSRNANAVINASNKTLVSGSSFNFKEGVTAFDNGGNGDTLTNKVTVTGSINTQKAGTYPITYKVTGANGVAVTKVVTVTVKAK